VLEVMESNARFKDRIAVFEIGTVFLSAEDDALPQEPQKLVIALTGPRTLATWDSEPSRAMDFFDLKGTLESFTRALRLGQVSFETYNHPSFHPGKCAALNLDGRRLGLMGELHPLVRANYNLPATPLLVAELDVNSLLEHIPAKYDVEAVKSYPPVLEDLAIVVADSISASQAEGVIWRTGGDLLVEVRLFDVFRGDQIGKGKKSLAYSLTYQAADRTLTDEEVARVRAKIIARLESELGAQLRA
jgi:phenylalanyl-tRNA synthetase beta chain